MPSPTPSIPDLPPGHPTGIRDDGGTHCGGETGVRPRGGRHENVNAAESSNSVDPGPGQEWEFSELVAGVLDTIPGHTPVPVSVWQATDPDAPPTATSITEGLTTRLARTLVGLWTDPGEIVVDTTADVAVEAAAIAGGRTYLSLLLPPAGQNVEQVQGLTGQVALILLRWPPDPPPPAAPAPNQAPSRSGTSWAILRACRALLSGDGHTVVILTRTGAATGLEDARALSTTAARAGLGHLQHVIVITAAPAAVRYGAQTSAPSGHVALLVFVLRRPRE